MASLGKQRGTITSVLIPPDVLEIRFQGTMDHLSIPLVEEEIKKYETQNFGKVVFEFSRLDFLNSAALMGIFQQLQNFEKKGVEVVISEPQEGIMKILKITHLESRYKILKKK